MSDSVPTSAGHADNRVEPYPDNADEVVPTPELAVEPGAAAPIAHGKPADSVAWSMRVAAEWCARILIVGTTVYFLLKIYSTVHLVAFSFIIGVFLAAVLRPVNQVLLRWHLPRSLAALTSVLLAAVVLAGIGFFVYSQISSNSAQLGNQLGRSIDGLRDWLVNGPLHLKQSDIQSIINRVTTSIKANQSTIATGAIATARSVLDGLSGLLLVVFTAFFLVRDGERIWAWLVSMLPLAARANVHLAGERSWATLGGYMRGQVTIAAFHAVSITIALLIFRVPLAAPLGVLVFLGSFIPLIGLIIAGALAVLITLLEHGLVTAVIILVIVVALVQLEGHVLQPVIMSRAVALHPLAVALGVLIGAKLDGIAGALIAVPLVAVANTAFRALHGVSHPDERSVHLPRPRLRRPKRRAADRPNAG